jgi:hypothetical protein
MRRGTPEEVDGNCFELDPKVLHAMRVEQAKIDGPARIPSGAADIVMRSIHKNHNMRRDAQHELRKAMALWAGWQQSRGLDGPEIQRTFFFKYGIDVLNAQVLGTERAENLQAMIDHELRLNNIVEAA